MTMQPINYTEMFSAARAQFASLSEAEQKARWATVSGISQRMSAVLCEADDGLTTLLVLANFLSNVDADFRIAEQPSMKYVN